MYTYFNRLFARKCMAFAITGEFCQFLQKNWRFSCRKTGELFTVQSGRARSFAAAQDDSAAGRADGENPM